MITTIPPILVETSKHTCPYHKANPGKSYAGCTCSSAYTGKPKPPEEWTDEERAAFFQPVFDEIFGR